MQRGKIKTSNEEICLLGGTQKKIAFLTLSKGEGAGVAPRCYVDDAQTGNLRAFKFTSQIPNEFLNVFVVAARA